MTTARIKLTKRKWAIVDADDFERLNKFKWCASNESRGTKWYAIRSETREGKRVKIRMHRFIMGLGLGSEDGRVVDHLNHNPLDNRKANLEIVDQRTNMIRSPGWKVAPHVRNKAPINNGCKCANYICAGDCE